MNSNVVCDTIFAQMASLFNREGFLPEKEENWFIKETSESYFMFGFSIYDQTEIGTSRKIFRIEPYLGIHIKRIEHIFLDIYHINYRRPQSSHTVGDSVFCLAHPENKEYCNVRNGSLKYYIAIEEDIFPVVKRLRQIYDEFAKKYFEQYGTEQGADKALNSFPDQWSTHNAMGPHRYMKGLIAAKLVHNPDYEKLEKIYDERILKSGKEDQESYFKVKAFLSKTMW